MADGYYTEQVHGPHEYFDLGGFELASGFLLPEARLAYKTMGTLSAAKDNAVLLPHMYTGTAAFMTSYIGPGLPLDPDKYFHFTMFNLREQDTAAIDAIYADVLAG